VSELDHRVRLAAFAFLDRLRADADVLQREALSRGFDFEGQRVPLMNPQGRCKPRVCVWPLSITKVPVRGDVTARQDELPQGVCGRSVSG
jgi:hypothetical protein